MCNFGVSEIHVELAFPAEYKNGNTTLNVISTLPPPPNWYFPHSVCFYLFCFERESMIIREVFYNPFWRIYILDFGNNCIAFKRYEVKFLRLCWIWEAAQNSDQESNSRVRHSPLCFNISHLLNGEENSAYIRKEKLNEIT